MKTCELLLTTEDGPLVVGTLVEDGGKITATYQEGYETLVQSVLDEPVFIAGRTFSAHENPAEWFDGLPEQYTGSYLRARIITPEH